MKKLDIFHKSTKKKIFFDIDSVWNTPINRTKLYKKLKNYNFKIYNFIYDLIPVLFPKLLHKKTRKNFPAYLKAIYKYSDFVFLDSNSAEHDFKKVKNKYNSSRNIKTKVVYLGSNFITPSKNIPKKYKNLLSKKYILFVGTIEPRKQQQLALNAFETLYKIDTTLHIIFIGKIGWGVDDFINKLNNHPLKDMNIHHLENINDKTLNIFYKYAFLVIYLSLYEGYGLPVVESLQHSNITIVSNNSSIPEVGTSFVEYIDNNSKKELIDTIKIYLSSKVEYNKKKLYILKNYKAPRWKSYYKNILQFLQNPKQV